MAQRLKLKKGDLIQVITGKDKGKSGKILEVLVKDNRVLVEGVNKVSKHVKPSQKNPQGGVLSKEKPIHVSNVMILDPKTNKPSRIGKSKVKAGKGGKEAWVRIAKKSGANLDDAKK